MRYLFIILLIPLLAFADVPVEDQLRPDYIYLSTHYPTNGATGVPVDTTIWFKVFAANADSDSVAISTLDSLWTLSIAGDQDTIQQMDTMASDRWEIAIENIDATIDCVLITPSTRNYANYSKIWLKIDGSPSFNGSDSTYFITEGAVTPLSIIPSSLNSVHGTTSTTTYSFSIYRPFGSTVYCLYNGTTTEAVTPDDDYDTERQRRVVTYSLSGVTENFSRSYWWCVSPEGVVSDTLSRLLYYKRHDGTIQPDTSALPRG